MSKAVKIWNMENNTSQVHCNSLTTTTTTTKLALWNIVPAKEEIRQSRSFYRVRTLLKFSKF